MKRYTTYNSARVSKYYSKGQEAFCGFLRDHQIKPCYSSFNGIVVRYIIALSTDDAKTMHEQCKLFSDIKIKELSKQDVISIFEIEIERYFIDDFEKKVVMACVQDKTPFTFVRTQDNYHHYLFGVDSSQEVLSAVPTKGVGYVEFQEVVKQPLIRKTETTKAKTTTKKTTKKAQNWWQQRWQLVQNRIAKIILWRRHRAEWKVFVKSLGCDLKDLRRLAGLE